MIKEKKKPEVIGEIPAEKKEYAADHWRYQDIVFWCRLFHQISYSCILGIARALEQRQYALYKRKRMLCNIPCNALIQIFH